MSTSKTSRTWTIIAFSLSIIVIGFAGWLFLNRQNVLDQLSVWSFEPSSSIKALDEKVQFTNRGKFIFYATKPIVANASEFNGECPRQEAGSPILGCYTTEDRIYVFDIDNPQLEGMKEVTAAHEMLHAVWERMSADEQAKIGALLTAAYEKNANEALRERMAYYQRNEPDALTNELHSILGTEVSTLGSELENYYAKYFKDRQVILAMHDKYDAVYTGLNKQAETLYADMQSLSKSIEERSTTYGTQVSQLGSSIAGFNQRANSGNFSSASAFNSERAALVRRSNQLEADRAAINNDITKYEGMYTQYQALASQIEVLNDSVDSFKSLDEIPQV